MWLNLQHEFSFVIITMITSFFLFAFMSSGFDFKALVNTILGRIEDLKSELTALDQFVSMGEFNLRISVQNTYQDGEATYFGRVLVPTELLFQANNKREKTQLMFVVGPTSDFDGPEDPKLAEVARLRMIERIKKLQKKAIVEALFEK